MGEFTMIKLLKQLFSFGIVGVICFVVDYGLLIILTEVFSIPYLLSCALSFIISTVVNYLLSMRYVFESKESINKTTEFCVFVIMSSIGLALNELLMFFMVDKIKLYYMISKIFATGAVMVYNFVTRKIFLEKHE